MVIGTRDPNGNTSRFEYDAQVWPVPGPASPTPPGTPRDSSAASCRSRWRRCSTPTATPPASPTTPVACRPSKSVQGKHDGTDWTGDPPTHPTDVYRYDLGTTPIRDSSSRSGRCGWAPRFDVVRYVDGFGRTVQERHSRRAGPGHRRPSLSRDRLAGVQPQGSGRPDLPAGLRRVPTNTRKGDTRPPCVETRYDPLGRVTRVDHPDGTFESDDLPSVAAGRSPIAMTTPRHIASDRSPLRPRRRHLHTPPRHPHADLSRRPGPAHRHGGGQRDRRCTSPAGCSISGIR